jgi:hypothetical protein
VQLGPLLLPFWSWLLALAFGLSAFCLKLAAFDLAIAFWFLL